MIQRHLFLTEFLSHADREGMFSADHRVGEDVLALKSQQVLDKHITSTPVHALGGMKAIDLPVRAT